MHRTRTFLYRFSLFLSFIYLFLPIAANLGIEMTKVLPPLAVLLLVQLPQLLQEARVWGDVPVGAHGFDGLLQRHALVDHQIGQDQ